MTNIMRVLVFPGGTEIGLEINRAMRDCKDVELFSAGSDVTNHAPFVYRNHAVLPSIHEKGWLDSLNALITRWGIDYLYPAYDDIIIALAEHREQIRCHVVLPSLDTCRVTRSKLTTYQALQGTVPVPQMYTSVNEINHWPVFLKPEKGQGSERTFLANTPEQWKHLTSQHSDLLTLEYLPGDEYTVDCFTNHNGELLFCSGRQRVRTKSGISMNSRIVERQEWRQHAEAIMGKMSQLGAWFYQMKEDAQGKLVLLEVAPRIGGTMATHRVLGINFPLLTLYEHAGKDVEILTNSYTVEIDRALQNRYRHSLVYDTVYIDFDDTLIVRDQVNVAVLSFLYQAKGAKKKIIMVTKSKTAIKLQLKKYAIATELFDEIISLKDHEAKRDFLSEKASIFIDDSFSERRAIAHEYNIPTFDCSMLEMLIDERV